MKVRNTLLNRNMQIQEKLKFISRDHGKTKVFYRIYKSPIAQNTLCMIHGLASNMTRWTELVENLELENFNLLRIDLRGHGESETRSSYQLESWIKDILTIFEQEEISCAVFLGHSLGATVSINLAKIYTERVKGLILIDPVFPQALTGQLAVLRYFKFILPFGITTLRMMYKFGLGRNVIPVRDLKKLDEDARKLLSKGDREGLAKLCMSTKEDLKFIRLTNYIQDLHIVLSDLPPLEDITQTTSILLSKGASISDFETNQKFIERFPNQKTTVIDADHWMLTEKPVETRKVIEDRCMILFN